MTDTKDLIARLEAATGPDRELDAALHEALGLPFVMEYYTEYATEQTRNLSYVPRYSASIDAALTLADAETDPLDILEAALASCREERDGVFYLPLHICIAALRACND